jgi:hypothetical protein
MAIKNTAIPATTNTAIYTSSGNNAITTIIVCNTNTTAVTGDRTLTLYAVENSAGTAVGTPSTGNMIVQTLTIPAGDTISFDQEKMVLADFDSVVANASGTGLTATVSTLPV